MPNIYFPFQFQSLLDGCSTKEQRQSLMKIRALIMADNTIQEDYNTGYIQYRRKEADHSCISIIFPQEWSNPKVFFTLFRLSKDYQWEGDKCRYAGAIRRNGQLSRRFSLYQLNKMIFQQTYRQLDKVLETFLEEQVAHLSSDLQLQKLIELAILFSD
ncbi:MAG: hypothetical protein AB4041_11350 [Microcystaceae cyanobacterium]